MDIASGIAKGLADSILVGRVRYAPGVEIGETLAAIEDDEEGEAEDQNAVGNAKLWDLNRPLCGDCHIEFLKFSDPEGKAVFWHSSSHILGEAMENTFGCNLSIGPAVEGGFYYDGFMGDKTVSEADVKTLEKEVQGIVKQKQVYERTVLTKDEALEMFKDNPFKQAIINSKVADGVCTTAYRCGPLIDLCLGPHIPHTGKAKAFEIIRTSSAYWLGEADNDSMQRVYAISFPDKKDMKAWKVFQEEAAKRDHRNIGTQQELFFFHPLSPGSAFFHPMGARIYNKLVEFIRKELRVRRYTEVITPNVFNFDLWHTSGHALHYKANMFVFDVEGEEFGMKPMNCPAHCLMFRHRLRSYKELPMRYADFGVLHRNELSGALTGLTRVRRFVQDDGHIFCRPDQIKDEVKNALSMMKYVYDTFGMTYKLELSTRPKKALGEIGVWNTAEAALAEAMDEFQGKGTWRVNPGDGAFYGPKIDIKVYDALERVHQCATIQLDFQLPIRFNLKYRSGEQAPKKELVGKAAAKQAAADAEEEKKVMESTEVPAGFERPVIVHRAMLGSVERMFAILIEHYAGKWPFWLSPRQAVIVPVASDFFGYAKQLQERFYDAGYNVDVDDSGMTLNKKIRNGQMAQYNFILCVGAKEMEADSVNVRGRGDEKIGVKTTAECLDFFQDLTDTHK
jgi:threonyl-tRNA synthetase